jgi:hypothetical protein
MPLGMGDFRVSTISFMTLLPSDILISSTIDKRNSLANTHVEATFT